MRLLAIDPGNEESAYVVYSTDTARPLTFGAWREPFEKLENDRLRALLWAHAHELDGFAIEMVASYGMAVGASVFETCVWAGRFIERWESRSGIPRPEPQLVFRRDVKLHICGSARAKDANVRQALIDRYGGKDKAIGRKATPGPLYGLSGDCWSALAVAITAAEADYTVKDPSRGR